MGNPNDITEANSDETAWEGEAGYVHCLLTTLAQGSLGQIKLTSKEKMPPLTELAKGNPDLLEWTSKLTFDYPKLNAHQVVKMLLYLAGFRWYTFFKSSGTLMTLNAKDEGTGLVQAFYMDKMKPRSGGGIAVRIQVSKSREIKLPGSTSD